MVLFCSAIKHIHQVNFQLLRWVKEQKGECEGQSAWLLLLLEAIKQHLRGSGPSLISSLESCSDIPDFTGVVVEMSACVSERSVQMSSCVEILALSWVTPLKLLMNGWADWGYGRIICCSVRLISFQLNHPREVFPLAFGTVYSVYVGSWSYWKLKEREREKKRNLCVSDICLLPLA